VSPSHNILYACSESIQNNDEVGAFSVVPSTGELNLVSKQSASGKSACYLTLTKGPSPFLLVVNYWDSAITSIPILPSGLLGPPAASLPSNKPQVAGKRSDHLTNRQSEAHLHALVLDPITGRVAYSPDLGEDCIKQFTFNPENGALTPAGRIKPSSGVGPFGPRYIEFHPSLPYAYLVNEISSTVSVFGFRDSDAEILASDPTQKLETLVLLQTISTIPLAFPKNLNTCGRITVNSSGNYVLVSNRGHNSIAVFRVLLDIPRSVGQLHCTGYYHTRGSTPRHFQFDPTGTHLIVANQDTDNVAVFKFDHDQGSLNFTGNSYSIPSPNFVCCVKPHALARM